MYCNVCGASSEYLCNCGAKPFCNPCEEELCTGERAECVYYNSDPNDINNLSCLALGNNISLDDIFKAIDERLCFLLNRQTPLSIIDTDSVDLSVSGLVNHTLTGVVKLNPSPNRITLKSDGLYDSEDGELTVSEGTKRDYLSHLVEGGTDGIITVSAFLSNGQVKLQPSLDISGLITHLACSMVTCGQTNPPPLPPSLLYNVYVGAKDTITIPTPTEILAGLHSFQNVELDVLADWTSFLATPQYLWYAIQAVSPLANKNFYKDNFNTDNFGNMLTFEDLFPSAVVVNVDGVNYYTNITNYKTQVGNGSSTFTLQKI